MAARGESDVGSGPGDGGLLRGLPVVPSEVVPKATSRASRCRLSGNDRVVRSRMMVTCTDDPRWLHHRLLLLMVSGG